MGLTLCGDSILTYGWMKLIAQIAWCSLNEQQDRDDEAVLRLIHVQNAPWATQFLLRKFNIHHRDDLVGTDFGKYVKNKRPERRGSKPFMSGRSWKTTRDPWRGIVRTSFGLDYPKPLKVSSRSAVGARSGAKGKLMELNSYDENDNPIYGYDGKISSVPMSIQASIQLTGTVVVQRIVRPTL